MYVSPSEMVGNSSGQPPASHTPRFTDSATRRRCTLHDVSSDHELQMPMTGRPSNTSGANPSARIQLRWMNPSRSRFPNHSALRSTYAEISAGLRRTSRSWRSTPFAHRAEYSTKSASNAAASCLPSAACCNAS